MSRRKRTPREPAAERAPDASGRDGRRVRDRAAPDPGGRGPARTGRDRAPDAGGRAGGRILRDLAVLLVAFGAGVGVAELFGAANLGVAFGVGQITFAIALVVLLTRG